MGGSDSFYAADSLGNQIDANWTAAQFWSLNAPPTAADDASLSSAYTRTLTLNTVAEVHSWGSLGGVLSITVGSLTIDSGANNQGQAVVFQGQIKVAAAGALTLAANAGAYQVYTLFNAGALTIVAGASLLTSGAIRGNVSGGGVLRLVNSTITTNTLTVAEVDVLGTVTLGSSIDYAGNFKVVGGVLQVSGRKLTLAGSGNVLSNSGAVLGPGIVYVSGSATFDRISFFGGSGGSFFLEIAGSVVQSGNVNFAGLTKIDAGATYTVTAASTIGANNVNSIVNNGAFVDDSGGGVVIVHASQFTNNGVLSINAGDTLFLEGGAQTLNGQITGAGTLKLSGTAAFNRPIAVGRLEFAGGRSTFGAAVTSYSGAFVTVGAAALALSGQTLTLNGAAITLSLGSFLYGPGALRVTSASTVDRLTLAGATLDNRSAMTATGNFSVQGATVGGTSYAGAFLNNVGATFAMAAGGITVGIAQTGSSFVNNGRIVTSYGAGPASHAYGLVNNGVVSIGGAGALELNGAVSNGGAINVTYGDLTVTGPMTGTGVVRIAAKRSARFEGVTSAQRIEFSGPSATLLLDAPASFSGTIASFLASDAVDFDKLAFAAGDHVGFATNGSGGGLLQVLSAGGATLASVAVGAVYAPEQFSLSADSANHVLVKFVG